MAVSDKNRIRYRSIMLSREVKGLFGGMPERFGKRLLGRFLLGPILRWMFLAPDGEIHRGGEIVLAELARIAGYYRPTQFHEDPQVMAYRLGMRDLLRALLDYLYLDESSVQQLMELDDGLE
jgi:hypothetical protein|tara:strand:+ start:272 stop:637 length:366 start_codon:yes stop_codon:yes gene_type:complete